MANIPKLPPSISTAYIKSTESSSTAGFNSPLPAVDWWNTPSGGQAEYNSWRTATNRYNGAKINIDFGTAFAAVEIKLWNYQDFDEDNGFITDTQYGFSTVKVYGSNSSTDFNNTTLNSAPAGGTLLLDTTDLAQEDSGGPYEQAFTFANSTAYRYYVLFFTGTKGGSQGGVRVVQLLEDEGGGGTTATIEAALPSLSATLYQQTATVNPPAFNATYVKSSASYPSAIYGYPWVAVNPLPETSGAASYKAWVSGSGEVAGAKINIDYGEFGSFQANLLRLWNFHENGSETDKGVASVRVYGSNTLADFDNTTRNSVPANGTLLLDTTAVARETVSVGTEQRFWLSNQTVYRYYILFFPTGHGHLYYTGIRKALLQGTPGQLEIDLDCLLPSLQTTFTGQGDDNVAILPVALSDTYVKSNGYLPAIFPLQAPYRAFRTDADGGSVIGDADYNSALGTTGTNIIWAFEATGRFIPDYFDLENYHDTGADTDRGIQGFSVYGGNRSSAFADIQNQLVVPADADLLYSGTASQHPATNTADRQRFDISTTNGYKYFYLISTSNHGHAAFTGLRRLTFWGAVDTRVFGDFDTALPPLSVGITTLIPEVVGHVDAELKKFVVQFSEGYPPSINAQLKPMTAFMVVDNVEGPPVGNLEITLPALTAENPTPAWGHLSCSLPGFVLNMVGRNAISVDLAPFLCAMQAPPASVVARIAAEVEAISGAMVTGSAVAAGFPALSSTLAASTTISGNTSATMRGLQCVITADADAPLQAVDVELRSTMPRLNMSSMAVVGRVAVIACSLRPLSCSSRAVPGIVGRVSIGFPEMRATGTGRPSWASLAATMQAIAMEMETENTCSAGTLHYDEEAVQ